jgi:hypothetical protein
MYIQVRFAIMGLQEIVENIHSSFIGVWGFSLSDVEIKAFTEINGGE